MGTGPRPMIVGTGPSPVRWPQCLVFKKKSIHFCHKGRFCKTSYFLFLDYLLSVT